MIGQSEKSGIEIESEYQLTGHPVYANFLEPSEKVKAKNLAKRGPKIF